MVVANRLLAVSSSDPCVCCAADSFREFTQIGETYTMLSCDSCGFTVAEDPNGARVGAEYGAYGDYLLTDQTRSRFRRFRYYQRHLFDQLLGEAKRFDSPLRVVDVGAGAGYFVAYCRSLGVDAVGVEPSVQLRDFALRTLGVHLQPSIESLHDEQFDAVVSQDVIEHVASPVLADHIDLLWNLTKPGGLLIGNTPNVGSLNVRIDPSDPVVSPPEHCSLFTPQALRGLLATHGWFEEYCFTRGFKVPVGSYLRSTPIRQVASFTGAALSPLILRFGADLGYQIHFSFRKTSGDGPS